MENDDNTRAAPPADPVQPPNADQPPERKLEILVFAGSTYYQLRACDGWPTGPCKTEAKALERVEAYERCEEVSQAAPGQASWAQMTAMLSHMAGHRDGGGAALIREALAAGLHTEKWAPASLLFTSVKPPQWVVDAGGTLVRRRLPKTAIPSRGL